MRLRRHAPKAQSKLFYIRYMDDFLIMAETRWAFRRAIAAVHRIMQSLHLRLHHQQKRFIGRVETGFDFLGYYFKPGRKLRPSPESLRRLRKRARRLYEREADINQLWRYVQRWQRWIFGGLDKLVSKQGGAKRTMRTILSYLRISRALI